MAWSKSDYIKAVNSIAADAIKEYPFSNGQHNKLRNLYVQDLVDGNELVYNYSANEVVLGVTGNEPDGKKVRAMCIEAHLADDAGWRSIRAIAASMAMEADVMEQIERLFDWTCGECEEWREDDGRVEVGLRCGVCVYGA